MTEGSTTATWGAPTPDEVEIPSALATLDGTSLGAYTLRVTNVRSRGYVEQVHFELRLADATGALASPPVFAGIYSRGRPSAGIVGWIDGVYCSPVRFPDGREIDLAEGGLDRQLFARLGALIPPNGRLMVAYEAFHVDAPILRETFEGLRRGVPPLATPLGELLYHADCWLRIRDWYIPEGGREGHRKLQGNRALDEAHRQRRAEEAVQELLDFLESSVSTSDALMEAARERSRRIIVALRPYVTSEALRRVAQEV